MNAPTTKLFSIFAVVLGSCLVAGCQQPSTGDSADGHGHEHGHDHDHDHGRPASLTAAVAELVEIRNEVQSAMRQGKPDDAHHPLHEVGKLLVVLPEVAADTDLPREKWDELKVATDKLFDAFGVIDEAFHEKDGDKKGAYEQVAAEIDTLVASLEALVPLAGEKPSSATKEHDHDHDHDHEHGDHDHDGHDHEDGDHDHDHAEGSKKKG